jgi:predicted enzyme involved in methoxymalonyl-ACP biosynthesis
LRELALTARAASMRWIVGRYIPTSKNSMVKEHYAKLGFDAHPMSKCETGETTWFLDISTYQAPALPMVVEGRQD